MPPINPLGNQSTITDAGRLEKERLVFEKQKCIDAGGQWNGTSCVFSQEQQVTNAFKSNKPIGSEENTKQDLPEDPLLKLARERGLSLTQAADVMIAKSKQSPENKLAQLSAENRNVASAQLEQQQMLQQQLGISQQQDVGGLRTAVLGENNAAENIGTAAAALGGGIATAGTFATAGAALGSIVPVIGTAAGAIGGAALGFAVGAIGGALVKLSVQKRQDVKQANKIFTTSKSNKDRIINQINAGMLTDSAARTLWAEEKANISLAHSYLKQQTQEDVNNFLGNPGDELIALESYLSLDQAYDLEFEASLLNPDSRRVILIPQETAE